MSGQRACHAKFMREAGRREAEPLHAQFFAINLRKVYALVVRNKRKHQALPAGGGEKEFGV